MFKLEWAKAKEYVETLAIENSWSKAFYNYAVGVCECIPIQFLFCNKICECILIFVKDMLGNKEAAKERFQKAPTFVVRKYGGRIISAEQYVIRKSKMYEDLKYELTPGLPGLEMIFLWNGFSSMSTEVLEKCLEIVDECLKGFGEETKGNNRYFEDQKCLLMMIKCDILQNLGKDRHVNL
jgi:hypothetical protein